MQGKYCPLHQLIIKIAPTDMPTDQCDKDSTQLRFFPGVFRLCQVDSQCWLAQHRYLIRIWELLNVKMWCFLYNSCYSWYFHFCQQKSKVSWDVSVLCFFSFTLKCKIRCWRDDSAVNSTGCSCGEPRFGYQHPVGSQQPSLWEHCTPWYSYIHASKTVIHVRSK